MAKFTNGIMLAACTDHDTANKAFSLTGRKTKSGALGHIIEEYVKNEEKTKKEGIMFKKACLLDDLFDKYKAI